MDFEQNELKEIWARSDEYFQFRYEEYRTFGGRLKKWRELNDISQMEMAEAIYSYRKLLGLEDDDILNEELKKEYTGKAEYKPIDYEIDAKRTQKKERRILSLMRTYHKWEAKETDSFSADTPFSMTNLRILKHILECDYEFLFCEIDTPHKHTDEISEQTGLNRSTIEKLFSYDKSYMQDSEKTSSATYAHSIITALDKMISDDDLMAYLSWYLTNIDNAEEKSDVSDDDKDNEFSTISINRPVAGVPTEDAYMDGTTDVLTHDDIHLVYLITIATKLSQLRTAKRNQEIIYPADFPTLDKIVLAEDGDSFGVRLRKWREYNHYTQDNVADLIYSYRKEHNLEKTVKGTAYMPEKVSVLRTYQNWEAKSEDEKDTRLSMTDLFILKSIMGCDYEYLFGEINTMNIPEHTLFHEIGLSPENIDKLERYAKSLQEKVPNVPAYAGKILTTIDLIVSDNDLLSNLAYYLSDMPFYASMRLCSILKPVQSHGLPYPTQDAYADYLFPEENELRNVFFPAMFNSLIELRKRNIYNNQPIIDHTNREYT